jgi:6-phosphogluconolactonase/glucosamine-6-phosphate isomerase/deaminase
LDTYVTLSIEETNGDEYVIDKKKQQWNFGYLSHTFHQNGRKREEYSQCVQPGKAVARVWKKEKKEKRTKKTHPPLSQRKEKLIKPDKHTD